jgi:hypothetical protein
MIDDRVIETPITVFSLPSTNWLFEKEMLQVMKPNDIKKIVAFEDDPEIFKTVKTNIPHETRTHIDLFQMNCLDAVQIYKNSDTTFHVIWLDLCCCPKVHIMEKIISSMDLISGNGLVFFTLTMTLRGKYSLSQMLMDYQNRVAAGPRYDSETEAFKAALDIHKTAMESAEREIDYTLSNSPTPEEVESGTYEVMNSSKQASILVEAFFSNYFDRNVIFNYDYRSNGYSMKTMGILQLNNSSTSNYREAMGDLAKNILNRQQMLVH